MWTADVVVLCDTAHDDFLPILAHRRTRGLPTIFEMNQHILSAQPWARHRALHFDETARSLYCQLASLAETLVFSTPALAEQFEHLGSHCEIVPSQLWETYPEMRTTQEPEAPPGNERIRIGWGGARGQREDILFALPVLRRIAEAHPQVTIAIMANPALEHHFAHLPANQVEFHEPAPVEDYVSFLMSLDIGVAPLLPSEFNHCRHDVKYLEYAATHTAPVCSDLPVYRQAVEHGQTGLLFQSQADLEMQLEKLVTNKAERHRLTQHAYQQVNQRRIESKHAQSRFEIYEEACSRARMLDTSQGRKDAFMKAFETHEQITQFPSSRYRKLECGRLEKMLYNGQKAVTPDLAECTHNLERARDLDEDFYLSHLLLGTTYPNSDRRVESLRRAREANRRSCRVYYELGKCFELAGDMELARRTMRLAIEAAPGYALGLNQLANYAQLDGELIASQRLRERALEANPWYREPARKLAQTAWEEGRLEAARKLLMDNVDYASGVWTDHYLLGQIYAEEHRYDHARSHLEKAQELEPDSREVLTTLSRVYLALGQTGEAREIMARLKSSPRRSH